MGVRGLSKLIAPCGKLISYDEYTGQYVAVDAFHRIYKCCSMKNMCDPNYKHAYIRSILSCITHLTQFGIAPIFVFDGMSLYFKTKYKESQKKRYDIKSDATHTDLSSAITDSASNIETASCSTEPNTVDEKAIFKITPQQIKECEDLINMLGLPCVRAPHEADSQCAAMTLLKCKNPVSVVLTDDTDALVFGAKAILKMLPMKMVNLLRDIFNEFISTVNNSQIRKYSIIDILKQLDKMNLACKISQEIDVFEEYDMLTIKNFSDRSIVHFAVRITLDDVLKFLDTKAQKIRTFSGNVVDHREQSELQDVVSPNMLIAAECDTQYYKQNKTMNHNDFINLCLLLGTDYSHRIYNASVEKIFELFVENNYDMSKIMGIACTKNLCSCDVKDTRIIPEKTELCQKIGTVRDYYECASVIDPNRIDMTIYKPNYDVFRKFLEYIGLDHVFISNVIRKYNRNISRMVR